MSFDLFKVIYLIAYTLLGFAAVVLQSSALLFCFMAALVAFILILETQQF